MQTDRPIVVIDCETTGLDVDTDRIVNLSIGNLDDIAAWRHELVSGWFINPGIPIPAAASEIHGITDADVADKPPFKTYASMFASKLSGVHLAGFNVSYDASIIAAEFDRAGVAWDFDGRLIDARGIFVKMFPRGLREAVAQYLTAYQYEQHRAATDVIATGHVLLAQLERHPVLTTMSVAELARFSELSDLPRADFAGKLSRDADGDLIFNFGKNAGEKLRDFQDYARWLLRNNFPRQTKALVRAELKRLGYHVEI